MGIYCVKSKENSRVKYWYIDVSFKGRRIREKVGTSRELAERVLVERRKEIEEGTYFSTRKRKKALFNEMCDKYIEHAKVKKRSWKTDYFLMKQLRGFFGDKYLHEIRPLMIEEYQNKRLKNVSASTVKNKTRTIIVILIVTLIIIGSFIVFFFLFSSTTLLVIIRSIYFVYGYFKVKQTKNL